VSSETAPAERVRRRIVALMALVPLLGACSSGPDSGPAEIAWDRDVCERCGMVVSDRRFAAQIRVDGGVANFDDLGCALVWLDEHPPTSRPEIWVSDYSHARWLDGYTASYGRVGNTPMSYGWIATLDPERGAASFEEVRERIREAERDRRRAEARGIGHQ
jgi:copper chaperone NosL